MKNELPFVTCFILNWNRKEETGRAIESVLNQTYSNIEILVIDNGSTDGSHEYLKSRFSKIRLIILDKNYGCPGGRNRGIEYCNGEYIFFCDNDGVLHEKAVENAISCILQNENIAVVTGLVKDFDYETEIDTRFLLQPVSLKETNLFQGGISMHRKSVYNKVGYYPDDYIYGGEETYLSYRLIDKGYKIVKSEQVILWHKKSKLASNIKKETIQVWGNTLMNAYQLYPTEYLILYYFYFFLVYPFYALQRYFLIEYLKSIPIYLKRISSYKRKPVKRKTFNLINNSSLKF